jgi:hypothetical protein
MLNLHSLLVIQTLRGLDESLRKWNMATITGMIDCCPAYEISVLNIGTMFEENFDYCRDTL